MINENIVLNLPQALELMTIAPCLVVIFYLLLVIHNRQTIVTIAYFVSLILSLSLAFISDIPTLETSHFLKSFLLFGEIFDVALCYLLILQLLFGKYPPKKHFLVLCLPLIGSSTIVYASSFSEVICSSFEVCVSGRSWVLHYQVFSGALILMLLIFIIGRQFSWLHGSNITSRHKYWVIIALIIFTVFSLGSDLGRVSGYFNAKTYDMVETLIKIGFVYLVLSSIFRVFQDTFLPKGLSTTKQTLLLQAGEIAKSVEHLLEVDKIYKDMDLHRGRMADMLNLREYQLSFVINATFKKSFTELVNEYRIREAKYLLVKSEEPITNISFETGFSSLTSFNRVFKQACGVSPSEFRIKYKFK